MSDDYNFPVVEFLEKSGVSVSIQYVEWGFHFQDDMDRRNIYKVTIIRGDQRYSYRFGDSVANTEKKQLPRPYDVLSCLTYYDPGTFENFCSGYGYDTDSRKAEKTWKAVVKEFEGVCSIFTESEREEVSQLASQP